MKLARDQKLFKPDISPEQGFGSGLLLTDPDPDPTSQDKTDPDPNATSQDNRIRIQPHRANRIRIHSQHKPDPDP